MAMTTKTKETQEDIELLLPWHAAGTLNARDTERVDQALANNRELADRYESVRRELGEAIHLNESLGAPTARAMDNLFAKIDAEPRRRVKKERVGFGVRLTNFFGGFSGRTVAYASAVAMLAIVLQGGMLTRMLLTDDPAAPQLSSYQENSVRGIDGTSVYIRFKPQATSADITKFLQDNKAVVIAGPTSNGMYQVRVSEMILRPADLVPIVKRLAANPVVGMTVPAAQ
jgi:hypothetical protein